MQVTVQPDTATARLSVEGGEWTEATNRVSFSRMDSFGNFVPLPGGSNILALGGFAVYQDLEMPLGVHVTYRATNEHGQHIDADAAESTTTTNLVTNPRGRNTSGTVVVRENLYNPANLAGWSVTTAGTLLQGSYDGYAFPVTPGEVYSFRRTLPLSSRFRFGFTDVTPADGVQTFDGSWDGAHDTDEAVNGVVVPANATHMVLYLSDTQTGDVPLLIEKAPVAGEYFDGDASPDTDLTPVWTGAAGASTSQLTAPKPVGWETGNGICYYSASQDALAFTVRATAAQPSSTYCLAQAGPGQYVTGVTEVIAAPSDAPWSVGFTAASDPMVGPGEQRVGTHLPEEGAGYAVYYAVILSDDDAVANSGATYYFRAAIILGTGSYAGPWWDGHTADTADIKYAWEGTPDDSASTRTVRDWSKLESIEWGLWLKSRKAPELTTRIEWEQVGDLISDTQGAVYEVYGGPGIGQFGGVAPEQFTLYGWVDGRIAYNRLRQLLKSDRQIFLQTGEPKEFEDGWVQVRNVSFPNAENRLIETGSGMRYVRMDCTRIEAPVGAPRGALGASYRTLYTTYDSYQDLTDSGLTYGDLLEVR